MIWYDEIFLDVIWYYDIIYGMIQNTHIFQFRIHDISLNDEILCRMVQIQYSVSMAYDEIWNFLHTSQMISNKYAPKNQYVKIWCHVVRHFDQNYNFRLVILASTGFHLCWSSLAGSSSFFALSLEFSGGKLANSYFLFS